MSSQTLQKNKKDDIPVCSNCEGPCQPGGSLRKCARCRLVSYCSKACQKQHWGKGGHSEHCVTPEQRRVVAPSEAKSTTDESEEDVCPVCYEPLLPSSADSPSPAASAFVVALPCSHEVHTACLRKLRRFGEQQLCPTCRTELPPITPELSAAAVSPPQVNGCANCGAKACPDSTTSLTTCARCKIAMYCGLE